MTEKLRDILIAILGASVVVGGSTFLITRHFCKKNVETKIETKVNNALFDKWGMKFDTKEKATAQKTKFDQAVTDAEAALKAAETDLVKATNFHLATEDNPETSAKWKAADIKGEDVNKVGFFEDATAQEAAKTKAETDVKNCTAAVKRAKFKSEKFAEFIKSEPWKQA